MEAPSEYAATLLAHARYFSGLAAREGAKLYGDGTRHGQVQALLAWGSELDNLYLAAESALQRRDERLLAPIAEYMPEFMSIRGELRAVSDFCTQLLETAAWAGDAVRLALHLHRAFAFNRQGLEEAQFTDIAAAAELARRSGSPRLCRLQALQGYGGIGLASDIGKLNEALANAQAAGDEACQVRVINMLGLSCMAAGQPQDALGHYQRGLAIAQRRGDLATHAVLMLNTGYVHYKLGEVAKGRGLILRAVEVSKRVGQHLTIGIGLYLLGEIAAYQGELAAAEALYFQSVTVLRDTGSFTRLSVAALGLGYCHYLAGRLDAAFDWLSEAALAWAEIGAVDDEGPGLAALLLMAGSCSREQLRSVAMLTGTKKEVERGVSPYFARIRAHAAERLNELAVQGGATASEVASWKAAGSALSDGQALELVQEAMSAVAARGPVNFDAPQASRPITTP